MYANPTFCQGFQQQRGSYANFMGSLFIVEASDDAKEILAKRHLHQIIN